MMETIEDVVNKWVEEVLVPTLKKEANSYPATVAGEILD